MTLSTCFARRSASVWLSEAADALASVFFPGALQYLRKAMVARRGPVKSAPSPSEVSPGWSAGEMVRQALGRVGSRRTLDYQYLSTEIASKNVV